ncbi:hypothetical protein ACVXHA_03300 [Escherichia coli]
MIKIGVIADDLPARRISPVFLVENGLPTVQFTVFQQVKCRKQSTHW